MAEIPVYKERRMYGLNGGVETSYKVKNSYAGILRLSPNNSASLMESNNLDNADETTKYINYEDSVTTSLQEQFLRVSTSDGVLLDLRISKDAVEYTNLYVQGAVKTNKGIICYLNDGDNFYIDNKPLPTTYNAKDAANTSPSPSSQYVPLTRENLEDGYLLVNMAENGAEPRFEYVNAHSLINKFVADELLKLNTLPAGSIHWMPVSLAEYQKLINQSKNSHNCNNLEASGIIRDFLLCDGSQYYAKDFPELAKILNKEKITYWTTDGDYMKKNSSKNDVETNKTFRVPDLRGMFLQYVIPKLEMAGVSGNEVGDYEIDAAKNPKIDIDILADKHYHYSVLDNGINKVNNTAEWSVANSKNAIRFKTSISTVKNAFGQLKASDDAKPLAKYGSARLSNTQFIHGGDGGRGRSKCRKACSGAFGHAPSYIYAPTFSDSYCTVSGATCGYFLSNTYNTFYSLTSNAKLPVTSYVGFSSFDIDRTIPVGSISASELNYTNDKTIYKKAKNYISSANYPADFVGKENSPEFFACLPLIKI